MNRCPRAKNKISYLKIRINVEDFYRDIHDLLLHALKETASVSLRNRLPSVGGKRNNGEAVFREEKGCIFRMGIVSWWGSGSAFYVDRMVKKFYF
jgi:hypothetical protein